MILLIYFVCFFDKKAPKTLHILTQRHEDGPVVDVIIPYNKQQIGECFIVHADRKGA